MVVEAAAVDLVAVDLVDRTAAEILIDCYRMMVADGGSCGLGLDGQI
jgi:hypothetical protein